ncbi:MAG: YbhB/YbcL family Raf kinase inhibitor-like protein [Candidatus Thermoplasmatota archaeon]|nr:YbhB/YbcL family Raf kinase inhibitor-like protein [Candidatus Thermoplasmatota archaeon]
MNRKVTTAVVVIITFIIIFSIGCVEDQKSKSRNMKLFSSAFRDGETIPSKYTCDGSDVSPPLSFSDVPENTKSLALIMDDPDAPMGTWIHWLVWNIPVNKTVIEENEGLKFPQGLNDFGKIGYGGPCPPSGTHRYYFKLYALDTMLNLNEGAKKEQLVSAMSGHIIEETQLMGKYSR